MKLLFEEAKQHVAKDYGYESWTTLLSGLYALGETATEANKEVCELMCNEAVKANIEQFEKIVREHLGKDAWLTIKRNSPPLPFPEII